MTKRRDELFSGFLPVNRKFFDHPFWKEERTFSKSEAWLDLIQAARFEESKATELIGGKLVSWTRGQLPASLRYLADRWDWSKNKVDGFLQLLEKEGMVERLLINGQTVIELKKYETYNARQQKGQQTGQGNSIPEGLLEVEWDSEKDGIRDERGTATGQRRDKSNKENKGNKEEDISADADVQQYSAADLETFRGFQQWIEANAPKVGRMKEPITIAQFQKLRSKFSKEQMKDLLLKMHNWAPLLKKNDVAYLTILNWSKRDYNQQNEKSGTPVEYSQRRKELEERTRRRAED